MIMVMTNEDTFLCPFVIFVHCPFKAGFRIRFYIFVEIFHCKSPRWSTIFYLKHFKAILNYESFVYFPVVVIDKIERKNVLTKLKNPKLTRLDGVFSVLKSGFC